MDGKKSNFYWLLQANSLWTKNQQTTYSVAKEELHYENKLTKNIRLTDILQMYVL